LKIAKESAIIQTKARYQLQPFLSKITSPTLMIPTGPEREETASFICSLSNDNKEFQILPKKSKVKLRSAPIS